MTHHEYALGFEAEVVEQIRALPREIQRPLLQYLGDLAKDPRPRGYEKLEDDLGYRVIWRSVRVTYWLDDANGSLQIARVAPEPPSAVS